MKPRITILAMLSALSLATVASAQVKTRDHRKQPPPPTNPTPAPPPTPPPPPAAPAWNKTGWTLLGELAVNGRRDNDVLKVGKYQGRFDQLTMVVTDSDLELDKFVVHFDKGKKFAPKLRHVFAENSRTAVIELPGNDRLIKKIALGYRNLPRGGKAFVQIWGRDTRPPEPVYTPPVFNSAGWESLGAVEVKGKSDHDTLKVGKDDGRFDKLTFVVHDNDLEMFDVTVTFLNGEKFSPTTRLVFKEGSRTGAIDLPGEQRYIKQIDFHYGNIGRRAKGRAKVEVFGKPSKYVYTPPVFNSTGWESLGTLAVKGKRDRDSLKVGRKDGRFTKLTIVVHDSDLEMYDIVIKFANGEKMSPSTRLVFKEGSRTAVIDLPGEKRYIKKIEFLYGNLPGGGAAKVEVFGMPGAPDEVHDHHDGKKKGGVKVRDHRKGK